MYMYVSDWYEKSTRITVIHCWAVELMYLMSFCKVLNIWKKCDEVHWKKMKVCTIRKQDSDIRKVLKLLKYWSVSIRFLNKNSFVWKFLKKVWKDMVERFDWRIVNRRTDGMRTHGTDDYLKASLSNIVVVFVFLL